jgi:outer membrane protein assembly factor BamB
MLRVTCATVLALLALSMSMIGRLVLAQDSSALSVVPSKATMLVGETHTFRAVGKDGRLRHNVRWNISPEPAAKLRVENDEVTLAAEESSSTVVLTAYAEGDSSEASIEILSGPSLPTGTIMWSVSPLPGCKGTKMTQAVPSSNGPDLYVEESCPDGAYVRALTSDGRELWRRKIGGPLTRIAPGLEGKERTQPADHINLSARSVCVEISSGMTKDDVSRLAQDRNLRLDETERRSNSWVFEEPNFRCTILFGEAGTVVKNKKIIITD